jgi:AraC-like DNA-binding protein
LSNAECDWHDSSSLPVALLPQEAGFADQSHMTRAFRRQFGVTPARYQAAVA